jgi:hypothetical protein
MTPKSDTPKTSDYRVGYLSIIGLIGFITGFLVLFSGNCHYGNTTHSIFHEIEYSPRSFVTSRIDEQIGTYTAKIQLTDTAILKATTQKKTALVKTLLAQRKADSSSLQQLVTYQYAHSYLPLHDSINFNVLNKSLHFDITPTMVNDWNDAFTRQGYNWTSEPVRYVLKEKTLPQGLAVGQAQFKTHRASSDISFITRYPQAGVWILLVLIFCSFCFLAFSTSLHSAGEVNRLCIAQSINGMGTNRYLVISLTALAFILLSSLIWKMTFLDESIVKSLYFCRRLWWIVFWLTVFGSLTGAVCLGGFIYTAATLSNFSVPLNTTRTAIAQIKLELNATTPDTTPPQLLEAQQRQLEDNKFFGKISRIFQTYFVLSAILLSLQILCTGALFNTVNSLDFLKLLINNWGYQPVGNDFIYLYGGLYTIILLLVYVPAKMRFSEVDMPDNDQPTTTLIDKFKNPIGKISGLLVATSPLLVSIIQSLFDILF